MYSTYSSLKHKLTRGATIIEAILTLPIFVLFTLFLIDIARYFFIYIALNYATFKGADYASKASIESNTTIEDCDGDEPQLGDGPQNCYNYYARVLNILQQVTNVARLVATDSNTDSMARLVKFRMYDPSFYNRGCSQSGVRAYGTAPMDLVADALFLRPGETGWNIEDPANTVMQHSHRGCTERDVLNSNPGTCWPCEGETWESMLEQIPFMIHAEVVFRWIMPLIPDSRIRATSYSFRKSGAYGTGGPPLRPTNTRVPTATFGIVPTSTRTTIPTSTLTSTATRSITATITRTSTTTRTFTPTITQTRTITSTNTQTFTVTQTFTKTKTKTRTPTPSRTSTCAVCETGQPPANYVECLTCLGSCGKPCADYKQECFNHCLDYKMNYLDYNQACAECSTWLGGLGCPGACITLTPTITYTRTNTYTPAATGTMTNTPLPTNTPKATNTRVSTSTPLPTSTHTITNTPINTKTSTYTPTITNTPLPTQTWTLVPTSTITSTPIATASRTSTITSTPVPTATFTLVPTPSRTPTWTTFGGPG